MKKRVLMGLALLTIVGASGVFAQAEKLNFTAVSGGYEVSGISSSVVGTDLVIPDTHNGQPVVAIATKGFMNYSRLVNLTMGNNIITIGTQAFQGCGGLKQLVGANIGAKVETIGNSAFTSCRSLERVWIRDNVRIIENNAFSGCTALTRVTFNKSGVRIMDGAFPGNLRDSYQSGGGGAYDGVGSGNNKSWTKAP